MKKKASEIDWCNPNVASTNSLMHHRDQATFDSFKEYWDAHTEERFLQAIRNWLGCGFLRADDQDTFYWETAPKIKKSKRVNKKLHV